MQETLSTNRVSAPLSRSAPAEIRRDVEPDRPPSLTTIGWLRKTLKNPLVLVAITWTVMAVMLARELFGR